MLTVKFLLLSKDVKGLPLISIGRQAALVFLVKFIGLVSSKIATSYSFVVLLKEQVELLLQLDKAVILECFSKSVTDPLFGQSLFFTSHDMYLRHSSTSFVI